MATEFITQFGSFFIQFASFSYLYLIGFDDFPMNLPRYPDDMIILVEVIPHMLEVNLINAGIKKKGYEFFVTIGAYSCTSRSNAKNMMKEFERTMVKHIPELEYYWDNCKDELES